MRKLLFLLPLLFVLACSKSASESSAAADAATENAAASADAAASDVDAAPAADAEVAVLEGTIDYHRFVMYLELLDGKATGHYFYVKQGKRIELSGTFDQGEGKYALTESVNGKTTGNFDVLISSEAMSGTWYAKPGSEPLNVEAKRLDVPFEPNGSIGKRIGGRYTYAHTTQDMSSEDSPEEDVTDIMAVRYIGGGYFSFYLSVIGANYHTGEVAGLAKMTDDTHAKTEMDDCALTFTFSQGAVNVDEEDCMYYHGARASFDVELTRE